MRTHFRGDPRQGVAIIGLALAAFGFILLGAIGLFQ